MRQRLLRPGFFSNDALSSLPPLTRIFYAGLWCAADREGRLEDRPARLKALILPYDAFDADEGLSELERLGFVQRYVVAGEGYVFIPKFARNQFPHPKEAKSVIPKPAEGNGQATEKPLKSQKKQGASPSGSSGSSGPSGPSGSSEIAPPPATPLAWNVAVAETFLRHHPSGDVPDVLMKCSKLLAVKHSAAEIQVELDAYMVKTPQDFYNWHKFKDCFGSWRRESGLGGRSGLGAPVPVPAGERFTPDQAAIARDALMAKYGVVK